MTALEIVGLIVLVLFCLVAAIQLYYYFGIFLKFVLYKPSVNERKKKLPVTIIICARNEEDNLRNNLPLVMDQEYPEFEVVVVNDCSVDETEDVLKDFLKKYTNLRTSFIKRDDKFGHGKKLALTVGIKAAKHEHVLLIDADCVPEGKQWLAGMARNFSDKKKIVLGYGGYKTLPGLLNMLIRYDAVIIALQYMSFALIGKPYMGVGRNLAYSKSLFFANKGFASHARLSSGDDDLFINEVATPENVAIEPFQEAHTRTNPKKTFESWTEQKKRHFTTFPRYKSSDKFLLGMENFSRVAFYFSFVALLILQSFWIVAVSVFFVRIVIQLIVFNKTFKRLNEKKLLLISPIFDFIFPFINLGIYISNVLMPRKQWR